MGLSLKPVVRALYLLPLTIACSKVYAAAPTNAEQMNEAMQRIATQTQQLQQQMEMLQGEMAALRQAQAELNKQTQSSKPAVAQSASPTVVAQKPANKQVSSAPAAKKNNKGYVTAQQLNVQPVKVEKIQEPGGKTEVVPYGQSSLANIGGFAVITSPFLHPEQEYSGGDLMVNYSSINKDVNMMKQRQQFSNVMAAQGFGLPTRGGSLLELSGEVESQINSIRMFNGEQTSDLYVADAELDMQALINRWMTAFMSFSYNNTPNAVGSRVGGTINLDNGFFTIGNLNISQWRLTAGQMYVPFGQYNSFLVSDPLNKVLFRTKSQPLLIGYGVPGNDGLAVSAFTFRGNAHDRGNANDPNPRINQYGGDANYQFHLGKLKTAFGASYIADVADASGMQSNGLDDGQFEGFGDNTETERLQHLVPGVDIRALFNYERLTLVGEFDTVTRSFAEEDLSFNGHGASPKAYHIETFYGFDMFSKPSTFAIGFDQTYQALGFNVPEQRIAAALNTSIWRNTVASLELRHDWNYSEDDYASGNGALINTVSLGPSSNAIFFQFQVYF